MAAVTDDADGLARTERITEIIQLLEDALKRVDALDGCGVIGAKLQGVIDDLCEERQA